MFALDQNLSLEKIYQATTSISANKSVDIQNGRSGSVFSWYLQVTGTIILDFTASTQSVFCDSSDWDSGLSELTLAGGTDSKFEIAGLYVNGGWNLKVSGEML